MSDLNADASVVGFYTSTNNGQVLATGGFIEALVGAQLSGGGVGSLQRAQPVNRAGVVGQKGPVQLPSGEANKSGKGIALVYGACGHHTSETRKANGVSMRRHCERDAGCCRPQGVPPLAGLHRRVPLGQVRHC